MITKIYFSGNSHWQKKLGSQESHKPERNVPMTPRRYQLFKNLPYFNYCSGYPEARNDAQASLLRKFLITIKDKNYRKTNYKATNLNNITL